MLELSDTKEPILSPNAPQKNHHQRSTQLFGPLNALDKKKHKPLVLYRDKGLFLPVPNQKKAFFCFSNTLYNNHIPPPSPYTKHDKNHMPNY
jgi:hypothetical protein